MTSRGPTEALGSGIVSDPGAPRVQTVSRGTYALVGPPPGRTETFWGQAEEDGTAVPTAMTRTPGGWQGRTTAPGVLPGAEAYNSRRTPPPPPPRGSDYNSRRLRRAGVNCSHRPVPGAPVPPHDPSCPGLTLAIPEGHKSNVWHLDKAVLVWLRSTPNVASSS